MSWLRCFFGSHSWVYTKNLPKCTAWKFQYKVCAHCSHIKFDLEGMLK